MNVQLGSGKVHYAGEPNGFKPAPKCGGNRAVEGYSVTRAEVNCKNCLKIMSAELDARMAELEAKAQKRQESNGESDTMAKTAAQVNDDVNATCDQIEANIERARSLAEAENVDGLATLDKETEALISSLPSRAKIGDKAAAQVKKDYRAAFKAAATVQEKPSKEVANKPLEGTIVLETRDYHDAEGVAELVDLGAQKFTEGVRFHIKSSDLAKDVARVILDMRVRMQNKEGAPDIKATSHGAKTASKDMYDAAAALFKAGGEVSEFDAKLAIAKLVKSVQNVMPTVRAEYLASLDSDQEEAARFAKILEAAPEGTPASKAVAAHYGVELKSRYMLDKERFEAEVGEAPSDKGELEGGEGEGEGAGESEGTSPAEQIGAFFAKAEEIITKAEKALSKAKDDDDSKAAATARIDALVTHLVSLKAGL